MNKLLDQIQKAPLNQRIGGVVGIVVLLTVLNFLLLVQPEQDAMEGNQNSLRALEAQLAELVASGDVAARIDRPAGLVAFGALRAAGADVRCGGVGAMLVEAHRRGVSCAAEAAEARELEALLACDDGA